jgi:hypothetical protein
MWKWTKSSAGLTTLLSSTVCFPSFLFFSPLSQLLLKFVPFVFAKENGVLYVCGIGFGKPDQFRPTIVDLSEPIEDIKFTGQSALALSSTPLKEKRKEKKRNPLFFSSQNQDDFSAGALISTTLLDCLD